MSDCTDNGCYDAIRDICSCKLCLGANHGKRWTHIVLQYTRFSIIWVAPIHDYVVWDAVTGDVVEELSYKHLNRDEIRRRTWQMKDE